MDCKKFLHAYQTLKFQENPSDSFSVASLRRKHIALSFYGSIHLKESNHVTEFLLLESFRKYAKIIDNKETGQINNYADYVLSLLSNNQNEDRKNWRSRLHDFSIEEHLDPLHCSNEITCKNFEFISQDIDELNLAYKQYQNDEKLYDLAPCIPPEKQCVLENVTLERKSFIPENVRLNKEEQTTRRSNDPVFYTAKEKLQIQNLKKFGKSSSSNQTNPSTGVLKKSLGARKGGIFGKFQPPLRSKEKEEEPEKMDIDDTVDERLKNIDPAMIETIKNEIMDCGPKISWDDIAGLHFAKTTIQEIVVWPMLRPDIFTGLRRPPKGILLFGPPGTGKTLIGKCIASQSNSTFFSISASSLTSKWVGDGEKMVRTLFAVAKVYQPSVIFIDEIDSLLSQRSDSEHESSRRIKTEFLVQLDGAGTGEEDRILIIGATNRPQELDEAARRRLVKRLYIPLPDESARKQMIEKLISTEMHSLIEQEIENIAKLTEGYSGADIKNLCQEASLEPIRSIPPSLIQSINPKEVRPLNAKDFNLALSRIKSSVSENDLNVYLSWDKQYGCALSS